MKKLIVTCLAMFATMTSAKADVNFVSGVGVVDCVTCTSNSDFLNSARSFARRYDRPGIYLVYNDQAGIFKTVKVTSRRFSEGAETIVSYRASIVANAPEHQQSFDLYMIEKSTESYIEVADVYLDVPYDGNLNPTSLFSQVNSMLFNSYGAFYMARIPAGTPIYVHMSNGYTIVFVKAADGNDTAIEYVVVLDENGYVVDSASNISSTQNSNGVVTYTLGLQAGTYYFTVNEREGIIIITQDPPPKEQ